MEQLQTETQQERFQQDGFYIHPASVLPDVALKEAAAGLEQVRDGIYDTGEETAGRTWKPGDDPRALVKIEQPQLANYALRSVLRSPVLGAIAGAITGAKRVQVWWVQGLIKPGTPATPEAATKVGWHQDRAYWGDWDEGSEVFTAWLALSDVTEDAGPMVFVTGSHKWGLLEGGNFFAQDQDAIRRAISIPEGSTWHETPDLLSPGGVSFHHRLIIHGSHQNTSSKPRRSLAIHMRTEKSSIRPDSWAAKYLDRTEICPVIFEKL